MVSAASLQIADLTFVPFLDQDQILRRVQEIGIRINEDFEDKLPVMVPILNGAFMFASDLLKEIKIPCEISFVKVASYEGTGSTGEVKEILGLQADIRGRHVILIEDIVDTGLTMQKVLDTVIALEPASLSIAALFVKPESLKVDLDLRYTGFEIENKFIVGYGLDYNGQGRNFPDVYQLAEGQ